MGGVQHGQPRLISNTDCEYPLMIKELLLLLLLLPTARALRTGTGPLVLAFCNNSTRGRGVHSLVVAVSFCPQFLLSHQVGLRSMSREEGEVSIVSGRRRRAPPRVVSCPTRSPTTLPTSTTKRNKMQRGDRDEGGREGDWRVKKVSPKRSCRVRRKSRRRRTLTPNP